LQQHGLGYAEATTEAKQLHRF